MSCVCGGPCGAARGGGAVVSGAAVVRRASEDVAGCAMARLGGGACW